WAAGPGGAGMSSMTSPGSTGSASSPSEEAITACKELGLTSLAPMLPPLLDAAREQQLPHELFLLQALQVERSGRAERARERRLRAAHLPAHKTLASFDFGFQPSLSQPLLRQLACLTFVQTTTNVIFLGPPGVGKTHLATALAVQALEAGHSVVFSTLSQLADGL